MNLSSDGPTVKKRRRNNWYLVRFLAASAVLIVIAVAVVLNFGTIKDIMIGMRYRPSEAMAEIRESLSLTSRGQRIFNATLPDLMDREAFNQNCREEENESAILGCYRDDQIYIYNVIDEELKGIRELTAAHELLHAVYERMPDGDKNKWAELLAQVYQENSEVLGREIEIYEDAEKQEELYVRAGTEVKNLPEALETHYAEIFTNQDKIVDFYESYITVFREIEQKSEQLLTEINDLKAQIDAKTNEYEAGSDALGKQISEFNECAKTADCFTSAAVFNQRRAQLTAEQQRLERLYGDISTLISRHNALVNEYNQNALHGQALNMTINSSTSGN